MDHRRKYHPTDYSGELWQRLCRYALSRADTFECALPYRVVVADFFASPLWPESLVPFTDLVLERYVSRIRWDLDHDFATQFVRFRLTPELAAYIRRPRALDDWVWRHDRPEDPSFFAGDVPVLTTESAAGRIAVYADDAEVEFLGAEGVRLLEPLGVTAEPWPTP